MKKKIPNKEDKKQDNIGYDTTLDSPHGSQLSFTSTLEDEVKLMDKSDHLLKKVCNLLDICLYYVF